MQQTAMAAVLAALAGMPASAQSISVTGVITPLPPTPPGSSWSPATRLIIGYDATGTMTVSGGATVTGPLGVYIAGSRPGDGPGKDYSPGDNFVAAEGELLVTGTGSVVSTGPTGEMIVGEWGNALLRVENGGRVEVVARSIIGQRAILDEYFGRGSALVTEDGSVWEAGRYLMIGTVMPGDLYIRDGGTVRAGWLQVATKDNIRDVVIEVDGPGSLLEAEDALLAWHGAATMTISGGAGARIGIGTAAGRLTLGESATAEGTIIVTGAESTLESRGLTVGRVGAGRLDVLDGAQVDTTSSAIIAWEAGSSGEVRVSGAGSLWEAQYITVGSKGAGTLTVAEGGRVRTEAEVLGVILASEIASGGGTLNIGAAPGAPAVLAGRLDVPSVIFSQGKATLNFNHEGSLAFDPALRRIGSTGEHHINHYAGTTTLLGGEVPEDQGYSGTTTVYGGTLLVGDAAKAGVLGGRVIVKSGGTLGGSGHIGIDARYENGNRLANIVEAGGVLAPGNDGIGTLTLSGEWHLETGAQLHVDIGAPGTAGAPGSSDRIVMTRDAHLNLSGRPDLVIADAGGAGIGHYRILTLDGGSMTFPSVGLFNIVTPGPIDGAEYRMNEVQPGGRVTHYDLVIAEVGPGPVTGDPMLQYWRGTGSDWTAGGTDWRNNGGGTDVAWAGNHGVFEGAGTAVALSGTHSFRGLQFTGSGYELTGPGLLETIASGSELRVLADETATIAAAVTGSGGIAKTQGGKLILTGLNTYTGDTVIEAGTLALSGTGSIAASGALHVAASGLLDAAHSTADAITLGSLFSDGIISLGDTDLNVVQAVDGRVDYLSGTGVFNLTGPGELTLTGVINMSQTEIGAGATLRIGRGTGGATLLGEARNDGTLIFDRTDTAFHAGSISGTGRLIHRGTGTMVLDSDSGGYAGTVTIERGTLRLTAAGILGSSGLDVQADGTLRGLGEIRGDVEVAGALRPGAFSPAGVTGGDNRLGTLTITGDLQFDSSAVFGVRIAGDGGSDALVVRGSAQLAGGVEVTAIDPSTSYLNGANYTILTASGGLTGSFDDPRMLTHSAFLTPVLEQSGTDVVLTLAVTRDFGAVAGTFNQRQAALGLFELDQESGSDSLAVFNAIAELGMEEAPLAFDLASGEIHASGRYLIDESTAMFGRHLRDQGLAALGTGTGTGTAALEVTRGSGVAAGPLGAWAAPLGAAGKINSDGNAAALAWRSGGLAAGYELALDTGSGSAVGGLSFGYIRSRGKADARRSGFDSDGVHLGAYAAWADGPWTLAGSLSFGSSKVSTRRTIAFAGRTARASYRVQSFGLSGEASYVLRTGAATSIAPLLTLDAGWAGHDGFTETGAGALNLSSGSERWRRLDAGIGLAVSHLVRTGDGTMRLDGRLVWEHAFADRVPAQALGLASSPTGFTVHGPASGRNRLRIGAGLSWELAPETILRARYDGLFSESLKSHTASLGLTIKF